LLAYPLLVILAWLGFALLYRAYQLRRERLRKKDTHSSQHRRRGQR
jgi:hypothetical protein